MRLIRFKRKSSGNTQKTGAALFPDAADKLVGYFLPYEGTNNVAWGLIAFDSLAAYEAYKANLKSDPEAQENFAMAQSKRLILREERNFVEGVESTLGFLSPKNRKEVVHANAS